jgi:hypothetical protein
MLIMSSNITSPQDVSVVQNNTCWKRVLRIAIVIQLKLDKRWIKWLHTQPPSHSVGAPSSCHLFVGMVSANFTSDATKPLTTRLERNISAIYTFASAVYRLAHRPSSSKTSSAGASHNVISDIYVKVGPNAGFVLVDVNAEREFCGWAETVAFVICKNRYESNIYRCWRRHTNVVSASDCVMARKSLMNAVRVAWPVT